MARVDSSSRLLSRVTYLMRSWSWIVGTRNLRESDWRLLFLRRHDLVEQTAVGEMNRLRFRPSTEVGDGDQRRNLRKIRGVFRQDGRVTRTIEILRGDLLSFGRVEMFEIRLRDIARAFA